ncbi:MAG: TraR/DksA family transcriptional regulator [Actinomycetota bacterium]|nr:TraR/DksA family transcriptional regulator [Actinomycetota bacterium]
MPEVKTASPAAPTRAAGSKADSRADSRASAKNGARTRPGVRASPATEKPAAKKPAAKKPAAKKPAAKKPAAKKPAAKKAPAKKAPAKKAPAKKAPAKKAPAKKATVKRTPAKRQGASSTRVRLPVRPGEDPWTRAERDEVRADLDVDRSRLLGEVAAAERGIQLLLRDGGDGAGNDQADVGSNALERDAEMSLANNSREMLFQVERALSRLEDGSYGVCESCGEPIGKLRLMAFPRATLCVSCKQRQERR